MPNERSREVPASAGSAAPGEKKESYEEQKLAYRKGYAFLQQGMNDLEGMILMNKKIGNAPIPDADADIKASREKGRGWAIAAFEDIKEKAKSNPRINDEYLKLITETKASLNVLPKPELITADLLATQKNRVNDLMALAEGYTVSAMSNAETAEPARVRDPAEVENWRANAVKNAVGRRIDRMLGLQVIGTTRDGKDRYSEPGIIAGSAEQLGRLIALDLSKLTPQDEATELALGGPGKWEVKYNGITFVIRTTERYTNTPEGYEVTIKGVDRNDSEYQNRIAVNDKMNRLFENIPGVSPGPAHKPDEAVASATKAPAEPVQAERPRTPPRPASKPTE